MTKVFDVLQVRVKKAHQLNYSHCVALAFFFVFQLQQVFDHLLNVPAVFTHDQVIPRGVIFHTLRLGAKYKDFVLKAEEAPFAGPFGGSTSSYETIQLFYKDLARVLAAVTEICRPQEIEALDGLCVQVQPDLAGACKGDCLLLNDLACGADQLDEETACLVASELEYDVAMRRVWPGMEADLPVIGGIAFGVDDENGGIIYFPVAICFFDPEIELTHIRRIRVVLILVFCSRTC